ncbi:hypothetical protein IV203_016726 [Nitzschia inconspicua]|uniref:Uncharacterized protein n=1 Tax=Nitzschia inconspicua TaxID=303405 RepID=A0A9K3KR26_9STRA|nr:hypothetical protein IV203_016726 [Nitzschia inconspicua]
MSGSVAEETPNRFLDRISSMIVKTLPSPLPNLDPCTGNDKNEGISLKIHNPDNVPGIIAIPRGGAGFFGLIPAGYHPLGYQITDLGSKFLQFDGSLESDVGRFLASLKTRKRHAAIKDQWLEIVRVSKSGQTMRIYRTLDDLIAFCIKARLLD